MKTAWFLVANGEAIQKDYTSREGEKGWFEGPADAVCGFLHVKGKFVAPPPRPATVEEIKDEAARRILEVIPRWLIDRQVTGGKKIPKQLTDRAEAIRTASDALEKTLPHDWRDDKHWG